MAFWHISRVISELCKPFTSFQMNLIVLLLLSINDPGKGLLNQRLYLCIALPKHIWTIITTAKQSVKRLESNPQSKTYWFHKLWLGDGHVQCHEEELFSEWEIFHRPGTVWALGWWYLAFEVDFVLAPSLHLFLCTNRWCLQSYQFPRPLMPSFKDSIRHNI
jgi:hypothetical protein